MDTLSHATTPDKQRGIRYLQWIVFGAVLLFPLGAFLLSKSMTSSFYLLLVCGMVGIACRIQPDQKSFLQLFRQYWPVNFAMAGLLLATLISQALSSRFSLGALVVPLQVACFPILFWILLVLPDRRLRRFDWGFSIGAIYFALSLYIYTQNGVDRLPYVLGIPINILGDLTLLLGFLALFSIASTTSFKKIKIILSTAAVLGALYATYLSQTRGAWVAIPLFVAIGLYLCGKLGYQHRIVIFLLCLSLFCGTYFISEKVKTRIDSVKSDLQHYVDGTNKDTSIGLRLQIWQGSWMVFKENSLTGIGRKQYPEKIEQIAKRNIISKNAASQPHSHNDILFQMLDVGIFGFFAMIFTYFVPAWYFFKNIRSADQEVRMIAGMGVALTVGFFIFGLSETLFNFKISCMFYVTLLAILFAFLEKRKTIDAKGAALSGGK